LIILSTLLVICFLELINYFDEIKNSIKIKETFTNEKCSPVCREIIKDYMTKRWGFDSKNDFIDCVNCPRVTHLTARDFDYSTFYNNSEKVDKKNNYSLNIINLKKQINASLSNGKVLNEILEESHQYYYKMSGSRSGYVNHWIIEYISSYSKLKKYIQTMHSKNASLTQQNVLTIVNTYVNEYKDKDKVLQVWEDMYDELESNGLTYKEPPNPSPKRKKFFGRKKKKNYTKSFSKEYIEYKKKYTDLTIKNTVDEIERERLRELREDNTYNLMISDRTHREYIYSKRNLADEYMNT
jgi:hypothetical protein